MSQDAPNPFSLPGMNAAFMNAPTNPVLTSMEMMRQAMTSMGYSSGSAAGQTVSNPMSPEELEKRIGELRVVENWLKLNLSMLASTIQGMEVQLATVKTLQSFAAMGQAHQSGEPNAASPLEVALGLRPQATPADAAPIAQPAAPPTPKSVEQAAAQNWWNMLQNQFSQIAAATASAGSMGNTSTKPKPASTRARAKTPSKKTASKASTSARTNKPKSS